jgi:hypothetical protein
MRESLNLSQPVLFTTYSAMLIIQFSIMIVSAAADADVFQQLPFNIDR